MNIRPLEPSDIPTLRQMYEYSGFAYEFPDLRGPLMESVMVVVDEDDIPVAACAAERLVQLYLLMDDTQHPAAKMRFIKGLHEAMAKALRCKGYKSVEAFLPPQVERSFGRRLIRMFGWCRNWNSLSRSF
jgi:hypothetical protein